MASLVKRGSVWYVAWREGALQRRKSLKTKSKPEALQLLNVWHKEQARERIHGMMRNPTVAVADAAFDVWARNHQKVKTRVTQRQRWDDFIEWFGGAGRPLEDIKKEVRMGDISRQDIQRFKTFLLDQGRSKSTVNNYLRDISARYGHAIKTLELFSGPNPCQKVERLRLEESPPPYLTQEQMGKLLKAAEAHSSLMHWFCLLGVYEGLRLGEIVNCRWEWFDWSGKLLNIPSDETFSVKSHKGRSIPLHEAVIAALKPHDQGEGYLFNSGRQSAGKHFYRYDPKKAFAQVAKDAGVPHISPHWLRHTFGSQLARSGVSIYLIREWMGHSDVKVTQRYAHVQGYSEEINKL
ncbi:MAG: site-specific integrase [Candidatus Hydrogenedentes bacterium]|nr:site-specific integrase [Candidatus Hydrogenedentota bacterium]